MASAVAAPIPRLAPVTTANRPASQCLDSATSSGRGARANDSPVQLFVSVETPLEIQAAFGVGTALRARQLARPPEGVGCGLDVVGSDEEACPFVDDHLAECAAL